MIEHTVNDLEIGTLFVRYFEKYLNSFLINLRINHRPIYSIA